MIKFLYGQDTYRSRQELNRTINHFEEVSNSKIILRRFDDGKIDFQEFKNSLQAKSIFKEKKIIVVSPFSNSDFEEKVFNF